MDLSKHKWVWCDLCEDDVVICGKCGNNTCNGGSGEVAGKDCDECESAYELYFKGLPKESQCTI